MDDTARALRDDPVLAAHPDTFELEHRRTAAAAWIVLAVGSAALLVAAVATFPVLRARVAESEPPAVAIAVPAGAVLLAAYLTTYALVALRTRTTRWRRRETGAVLVRRRRRHHGGELEAAALHAAFRDREPARFPSRPAWFRRGDVVVTTYADVRANVLLVTVALRRGEHVDVHPLVRRDGWAATRYGAPPDGPADATGPVSTS